jgi:nitrite reductase (NADH) small subunit
MEMKLGPLSAIPPGEGRTFQVNAERVAVFRTRGGQVFATQAHCPHRGGPLSDGLVGGNVLICPLHARKFDLETGEALGSAAEEACRLKTYAARVDGDGSILLQLEARAAERALGVA